MSTETTSFAGTLGLSSSEVRVLGCLLEKQSTTPDAYPLTLNALRMACNQTTNRDPVVDYEDAVIRDALRRLERRGFIRLASGRGSRAAKYRHLLAQALPMSAPEQAIVCVLMLRGAQTPGELKQRTERMHLFGGLDEVQETLARLMERELAVRLERRPGQKEDRYAQLLEHPGNVDPGQDQLAPAEVTGVRADGALPPAGALAPATPRADSLEGLHERLARLEREVAALRAGARAAGGAEGLA